MNTTKKTPRPQFKIGQQVWCNGYEGAVTEICTGQLTGMIVVRMRLARGSVCVDAAELARFNHPPERAATNRPGDQAAMVAEETGMSYSDALVFCNMD